MDEDDGLNNEIDADGKFDIKCCQNGFKLTSSLLHPECFPIDIPRNDFFYGRLRQRCMEFVRSMPAERPDCSLGPREQVFNENMFDTFDDRGLGKYVMLIVFFIFFHDLHFCNEMFCSRHSISILFGNSISYQNDSHIFRSRTNAASTRLFVAFKLATFFLACCENARSILNAYCQSHLDLISTGPT